MDFEEKAGLHRQTQSKISVEPQIVPFFSQFWYNYSNFSLPDNFMYFWVLPYQENQSTQALTNKITVETTVIPVQISSNFAKNAEEKLEEAQNKNLAIQQDLEHNEDLSFYRYFDPNQAPVITSLLPSSFKKLPKALDSDLLSQKNRMQVVQKQTGRLMSSREPNRSKRNISVVQPNPQEFPFIICKLMSPNSKKKLFSQSYYEKYSTFDCPRQIDPLPIIEEPFSFPKVKIPPFVNKYRSAEDKKLCKAEDEENKQQCFQKSQFAPISSRRKSHCVILKKEKPCLNEFSKISRVRKTKFISKQSNRVMK